MTNCQVETGGGRRATGDGDGGRATDADADGDGRGWGTEHARGDGGTRDDVASSDKSDDGKRPVAYAPWLGDHDDNGERVSGGRRR